MTFATHIFERMARMQREALGMPDLHLVIVPQPYSGDPVSHCRAEARGVLAAIRNALLAT